MVMSVPSASCRGVGGVQPPEHGIKLSIGQGHAAFGVPLWHVVVEEDAGSVVRGVGHLDVDEVLVGLDLGPEGLRIVAVRRGDPAGHMLEGVVGRAAGLLVPPVTTHQVVVRVAGGRAHGRVAVDGRAEREQASGGGPVAGYSL